MEYGVFGDCLVKNFLKKIIKILKLNSFFIIIRIWINLPLKNFISFPICLITFFGDYFYYKKKSDSKSNNYASVSVTNIFPCVFDKTETTPVEPVYFYQDCWAALKIFSLHPDKHIDVGSSLKTIGIISQFVKTDMVDIRQIPVSLPNLKFIKGNILDLPYEDNSIQSLSSLCVIEHIGLGRYGDEIDPEGTLKAVNELKRVLSEGGGLLISLPVDAKDKIYFNAHRAFTRESIIKMFDGLKLIEEKYQYSYKLYDNYDPAKGFGTGLFYFIKLV